MIKDSVLRRAQQRKYSHFLKLGDVKETKHGPLIWIDRGSDVLGIAHLDYVLWNRPSMDKKRNRIVNCPQLDDRLGVAIILDVLPKLGANCDVLLTDSEEKGQSTSQFFKSPKEYNWMFQFDRAGDDVVNYQYEDDAVEASLTEDYGWEVGWGTFSDISSMDHLGILGFNFGCGYHSQHTYNCYADLKETQYCIDRFLPFYEDHKEIRLDWEYKPRRSKYFDYSSYYPLTESPSAEEADFVGSICINCGSRYTYSKKLVLCNVCFEDEQYYREDQGVYY